MKKCLPGEAKKKGVTDIFRRAAAEGSPSAVFVFAWEGIRVFAVRESVFRGVISRSETAGARRLNTKSAAPVLSGAASVMKDGRQRSQVRLRAGARARVRYGVSPAVYTVYRWQERGYRAGCRSPRADRRCPAAWQRGHPGQVKRGRCRARRQWRGSGGGRGRACHRPSRGRSGRVPAGHSPRSRR